MNEYHFDLVNEPWIPCVRVDGTVEELGLRRVLEQAQEIKEIVDPSPLVTASLHRLLLAILHRNVGPKDRGAWEGLWQQDAFDMVQFDTYFTHWYSRFDLFDAEYPFYQWPSLDFSGRGPIAKLTHEMAAGNNTTLFDHTTERAGSTL